MSVAQVEIRSEETIVGCRHKSLERMGGIRGLTSAINHQPSAQALKKAETRTQTHTYTHTHTHTHTYKDK